MLLQQLDGVATPICISLTPPITHEEVLLIYYSGLLFLSFGDYRSCRHVFCVKMVSAIIIFKPFYKPIILTDRWGLES